jgi:hypothetical protein
MHEDYKSQVVKAKVILMLLATVFLEEAPHRIEGPNWTDQPISALEEIK